ncbi:glutamate 5-kinase [Treponema sp. HNW]|uniref:glutamate 5-kinase n=1 Tax=Treponema sp. HNW TaxID=3116654 RepID=UPI003D0BABCC
MNIAELIAASRKIVIKIGSNTLAKPDGTVNTDFMDEFAAQCADLIAKSKQVVVVSSGAQVAGMSTLNRWTRKKDIHYRQALCAIGQVELMHQWRTSFFKQGLHIGQLLLTKEDFNDSYRTLNMRNTLFTLVDEGVIPVINENDSICVEEIRIGDNDNLSALTAELWAADLLILCSDIDGVYTANPKEEPDAELIQIVTDIHDLKNRISIGSANAFGTGGMATKLQAAEKVTGCGIPMILTNGGTPRILEKLAFGSAAATLFCV